MKLKKYKFKCVLHGSFGKHFEYIKKVQELFTQTGIEVLAPAFSEITRYENGFAILETDKEKDHRMIELLYLHHLKRYENTKGRKEILLVKTHKWGGRYSIVGGRVRRNERLNDALAREVKEETGLKGYVGENICTFDQIKNSGYYLSGIQHIFVDKVVKVNSKKVRLNEEAQEYLWLPAEAALRELDIEPNARHTLDLYSKSL